MAAFNEGHADKTNGEEFNPPPQHQESGDDTLGLWYRRGWEAAAKGEPPRPTYGAAKASE